MTNDILIAGIAAGSTLVGTGLSVFLKIFPVSKAMKEIKGNIDKVTAQGKATHDLLLEHINQETAERKFFYEMNLEYKNFLQYCHNEKLQRFALETVQRFETTVWKILKDDFQPALTDVYLRDLKNSREQSKKCGQELLDEKFCSGFVNKINERYCWFDRDLLELITEQKRNGKKLKFARMCADYVRDFLVILDEYWDEYQREVA